MPVVEFAEKWPVLGWDELASGWLQIWADLGRAPRTIDADARGLAEYLDVCERENVDPATANRAHVAVFVRELTSRPSRRGSQRHLDRLRRRAVERHDPAAARPGPPVL